MKFLPPPHIESPQQRYSGVARLEKYIDNTKQLIDDNLPSICQPTANNLTRQQRKAIANLRRERQTVTIKPADKNLGIVIMNTDDYIQQCVAQLSDTTTYQLATSYPATDIERRLSNTVAAFKKTLESFKKRLYTYLKDGPRKPRIPQIYGLPKIHKPFTTLPPIRPIVSQTLSRTTPSARFIDHVLQPLAQSYNDYLHNSRALSLLLQDLHVPDNAILVTIDVVSLYPSIPQTECLDTIYKEMCDTPTYFLSIPTLLYTYYTQTSTITTLHSQTSYFNRLKEQPWEQPSLQHLHVYHNKTLFTNTDDSTPNFQTIHR